jgi:hypothetical protein
VTRVIAPTSPHRTRFLARAAIVFAVALLPMMLAISADYGATFDEPLQQYRGENILNYYLGRVDNLTFEEDGSHLYGAPLDVLAVAVQRIMPADPYVIRHALNASVGWLGIACTGLLAYRLFGPGTALLSMVLLTTMPRYLGHAMNNPKDIPFATLAVAFLYLLFRLPARYPFFSWRSAAAMTAVLALALNVRPAALLFLVYAAALLGFRLLEQRPESAAPALKTAAWLAVITFVTLCLGSLFWPWALERPVLGPILAMAQVSRFGWVGTILFNGRDLDALQPVWDYVPRWLLITTPLVTLLGLALSLPLLRDVSSRQRQTLALWATVAFPIVYVIGVRAILYDEIRHLLFIQPSIAVLAAAGWTYALGRVNLAVRSTAAVGLCILLVPPIVFEIREHPNQVVYFNELVGGPRGAFGRYEMDYWGNCLLQALGDLESRASADGVRLHVAGWPGHLITPDARRFPHLDISERAENRHQLDLLLIRGTRALVADLAARPDIVVRVATTDGALLCAVLPGPAYKTLDTASQAKLATAPKRTAAVIGATADPLR